MTDVAPSSPVLDAIPVVVCDAVGSVRFASPAAVALAGLPDGSDPSTLSDLVHPADCHAVAEAFVEATARSQASATARVPASPADRRLSITFFAAGDAACVAVLQDVTEEWRLATATWSLLDPTDGAVAATSSGAFVRRVRDRVESIPDLSVAFYLRDGVEATLAPVPSTSGATDDVPAGVAEADRTGAITRVERETIPAGAGEAGPSRDGIALPLGDHGVMLAVPDRDPHPTHVSFLHVVAAIVAISLDRLAARRTAKHASEALDRREGVLDRLRSVENAVRRVERRAIEAESADAVHRALCEGLVALDSVAFARYASLDEGGGRLGTVASAGDGGTYLDDVDFGTTSDPPPVARAAAEFDAVSVPDIVGGYGSAGWRRAALGSGFRSVLAVPVAVEDTLCGVVAVYAREANAFDETVRRGLTHLARTVGYVLQTLQLRSIALGATTVQLVLSIPDEETPLSGLAESVDAAVRFESATSMPESALRVYVTADSPPEEFISAAERVDDLDDAVAHGRRDDAWLYEVVLGSRSIPATLASLGSVIVDVRAESDGVRATVSLPRSADVRSFVDSVREVYPGTRLLARRTRDHPIDVEQDVGETVMNRLTDRQREVLLAAYFGGYFKSPRDNTASDLAADLDITQPTFASHLRTAERKLLDVLLADEG